MAHRHVCVHVHFDEPSLADPWLGRPERDGSALPFHDRYARRASELWGPMALGVRAGSDGRVIAYDNLLRRVGFDFAPEVLAWLERERPSLHRRILDADRESAGEDGLGNALARPYADALLPAVSPRDRRTLILWGLADFRARFGREALGMALPGGAADDATLGALAAAGLKFTLLDPSRALEVRVPGGAWTPVDADALDPKTPYLWTSPGDPALRLAVFFRHRRLSEGLDALPDAEEFCRAVKARLMPGDAAQAVHAVCGGGLLARRPGIERLLALGLDLLEHDGVTAVNHSRFLKLFPPPRQVRIRPFVPNPPLQGRDGPPAEALDKLGRRLDVFYEDEASLLFADPWAARDAAVELWLGRRPAESDRALRLLALQRERLAMLELRGLFLRRAARALDLAKSLGEDAEAAFVERLAAAGAAPAWRAEVLPARVPPERAAAHAALLDHLDLPALPEPALRVALGKAFRSEKRGLAGRDRSLSLRIADVERPQTGEAASFHAIVHRADRLDLACWTLPAGKAPPDAGKLEGLFLRLPDDEFRSILDERLGPSRFGLDAVFSEERAELAKALAPEGGLGPERALLLRRWTACAAALRAGGTGDDALLELLAQAAGLGLRPEDLPWGGGLEERLHERLAAVLDAPADAAAISRALRWLDALRAAGAAPDAWRLRDFQDRWRRTLEPLGPGAALDACRALGAKLGLAETMEATR